MSKVGLANLVVSKCDFLQTRIDIPSLSPQRWHMDQPFALLHCLKGVNKTAPPQPTIVKIKMLYMLVQEYYEIYESKSYQLMLKRFSWLMVNRRSIMRVYRAMPNCHVPSKVLIHLWHLSLLLDNTVMPIASQLTYCWYICCHCAGFLPLS